MAETTVFQSGNSQAVRLPKEFRFLSKTVEIFRRGDEVVLREKRRTLLDVSEEATAGLPPLTDADIAAFDEAMAVVREPQPPLKDPDFSSAEEQEPPRRDQR